MNKNITIGHLYPSHMNIYGDNGNVQALRRRLEWRNITTHVIDINPGDRLNLNTIDILVGGGGQDSGQIVVEADLLSKKPEIVSAANDGVVMIMICGLYQLFGNSFETVAGEVLNGLGIFDIETKAGPSRMIGNCVVETEFGTIVGFENHSGETALLPGQQPLGQVRQGGGNSTQDNTEGAVSHNVFGSYLHGPLLPRNPKFTDMLINRALTRKYGDLELDPLDDDIENKALRRSKLLPY